MNFPAYTMRRATVDDLGGLKLLWERARFQVLDLEKRLTDFQLIASDAGDLIGAIGLHIDGKQGRLHSGAFTQPELEEEFRPQLWARILTVARNHGLVRLWTCESAPFWQEAGFAEASDEAMNKLPPAFVISDLDPRTWKPNSGAALKKAAREFGDRGDRWLTLQLKDENAAALSLEHEFELFQTAQKEETEKLLRLGRTMKFTVFAIIGIVVVVGGFFMVKFVIRNPSLVFPGSH